MITITKEGEVYLNDKPANVNSLGEDIKPPLRYAGRCLCASR